MPRLPEFALLAALSLFAGCTTVTTPPLPAATAAPTTAPAPPDQLLATPPPPLPDGPLELSVQETLLRVLEHNRGLAVQRLAPAIARTREAEARAAFDPTLGVDAALDRTKAQRLARAGSGTESTVVDNWEAGASLTQPLPTGTTLALEGRLNDTDSSLYSDQFSSARAGLTVTQALLQGFGPAANLARLREARLDTRISQYEVRAFAEQLVADTEKAYWRLALAEREIAIYEESLQLAQQQLEQTRESIRLGRLSEIELAAAEAELALRQEGLINARADRDQARLRLLYLLQLPEADAYARELRLTAALAAPPPLTSTLAEHLALAQRQRPDLHQARLELQRGDLELIRTRNGLLPRLDLFVTLGQTGYANTIWPAAEQNDGESYDTSVGLQLEWILGRRGQRAAHDRAHFTQRQAEEALANLTRLAEADVRGAWVELERTRQQIAATAATRRLQEAKYRAEEEKFRVGRSTTLLVAQAQRDLFASRLGEETALVAALHATIDLYRLEGSLLARRGIAVPTE